MTHDKITIIFRIVREHKRSQRGGLMRYTEDERSRKLHGCVLHVPCVITFRHAFSFARRERNRRREERDHTVLAHFAGEKMSEFNGLEVTRVEP